MERASKIVQKQSIKNRLATKIAESFGVDHVQAAEYIVNNESGFNYRAINRSSGAGGLGQALPYSKTGCTFEFKEVDCQIEWFVRYIRARYQNPINAQTFWDSHRWY